MERFRLEDEGVRDSSTGLVWAKDAAASEFPLSFAEALDFVEELNRGRFNGRDDWRLPGRRELLSLVSHDRINPCLPPGHPFVNVENTYYWTSTTCARLAGQAWYVHFGGARVFKGMKQASYMVWPVRGKMPDFFSGSAQERFSAAEMTVFDRATGLVWTKSADCAKGPIDWEGAKNAVREMNRDSRYGFQDWRIPGILELETLVDLTRHSPALPSGHPFSGAKDFYWSATTSKYDESYAWALYLRDGALGVGVKTAPEFFLWAVRNGAGKAGK